VDSLGSPVINVACLPISGQALQPSGSRYLLFLLLLLLLNLKNVTWENYWCHCPSPTQRWWYGVRQRIHQNTLHHTETKPRCGNFFKQWISFIFKKNLSITTNEIWKY